METLIQEEVKTDTETAEDMSSEITINEIELEEPLENVETPSILRTSMDGCFEIYKGAWGSYLRQTSDPDANVVITQDHYDHFELNDGIHRIPHGLWQRWIQLCFHFVDKVQSSVEVSIRILRSEEDPSKYRFLVPEQKVSGATVRVDSFDKAIDIETGEVIDSYPPVGWIPVGSSHSHNTMPAFFSGTDDKYELGDPGIHIVVGSIVTKSRNYTIAASVVGNGRRFKLEYDKLVDTTPVEGFKFHPDVLSYVDYSTPITTYRVGSTHTSSTYNTKYQKNYGYLPPAGETTNLYDKYSDPYWYSENAQDFNSWQEYYDSRYGVSSVEKSEIKIHNIEDVIIDYQTQHSGDLEALSTLMTLLRDYADDFEQQIESSLFSDI